MSSGERKSGPQPANNSLASLRHQRGKDSTDPRPANACTNSCANSALLNDVGRKLAYCFAEWHCYTVINKTKELEQRTLDRHKKQ